jgi:hypothetical protein
MADSFKNEPSPAHILRRLLPTSRGHAMHDEYPSDDDAAAA